MQSTINRKTSSYNRTSLHPLISHGPTIFLFIVITFYNIYDFSFLLVFPFGPFSRQPTQADRSLNSVWSGDVRSTHRSARNTKSVPSVSRFRETRLEGSSVVYFLFDQLPQSPSPSQSAFPSRRSYLHKSKESIIARLLLARQRLRRLSS